MLSVRRPFFSSLPAQLASFLLSRSRQSSTCSSIASNSTNCAVSWSPVRTEPNAARRTTTTATNATVHSDMPGKTATYNWVSSLDNLVPLFSLPCFRDCVWWLFPHSAQLNFPHAFGVTREGSCGHRELSLRVFRKVHSDTAITSCPNILEPHHLCILH